MLVKLTTAWCIIFQSKTHTSLSTWQNQSEVKKVDNNKIDYKRVWHSFRLTVQDDKFRVILDTFELSVIFEAAGAVVKIDLSLK